MSEEQIRRDAERLLRSIAEHHDGPPQEGTPVSPHAVAHHAGLEPGSRRYEAALDYLEAEGALDWEERTHRAVGRPVYRMTRRGMEMVDEL